MEKHSRGVDFFRPPPTSPRGHSKKKLRREGPPRQREDTEWLRPPPSSKPLHLGGYLIESNLKIRGKSHRDAEPDSEHDSEPESNSLGNLERTFVSTAQSIFALVQNIESVATNSGYSLTHPIPRAVARIQAQLDRLNDGMSLRKDLDDCKTTNFKLTRHKKDLGEETEDHEAEHARLERSLCELQEERRKTGAEKLWLEDTVRKRDVSIENLVKQMEEDVEALRSNNLGLQSLVQQREAEAEAARAESLRFQGLISVKEAQIASLAAAPPITPVSPLGPPGPLSLPAGPALPTVPQGHTEAPDLTPPAAVAVPATMPSEQAQDVTQHISHFGAGAADVLSKLFDIDSPIPCDNPVLSCFLGNLGAAPETSSITVTQPTTKFWTLSDPWTTHSPPQPTLRGTLEEQFTHLCLLFPFTGTTPSPNPDDDPNNNAPTPATFHLLTSLLTTLTRADYSTSPRAAWAFLQSMHTLPPFPTPPTPSPSATATRTALLSVMLAELCRALAAALQMPAAAAAAPLLWQKQQPEQGDGAGGGSGECQAGLVGRLAGLLRDVDRDGLVVSGDGFCAFSCGGGLGQTERGAGGALGREVGLLHCGGGVEGSGSSFFLMIDFGERSLRAVDCRLAGMRPNATEPRKLDLIIARAGDGLDGGEEEELFRLAAAPRDVAAFWVKYAMGDD
ncbi:hypothetical protein B0I37DRAFT_396478 [Chaetomium sp. MPI-CAGE-AT-0009]|nr:hypothetical protein B0I37DRAFT_396478 [Chaetomium sp. MPI-CAGE-AT-0009]